MKSKELSFSYEVYENENELRSEELLLLTRARNATDHAYAPYSNFHVGAAAKLANGEIISGSNQENASFPVGICAERVLLSAASAVYPNIPVVSIAITYQSPSGENNGPVAPCGICRQTLHEYEIRNGQSIRLILSGMNGKVYIIPKAGELLPLAFSGENLK
ncbi:MAG TPA: cytidine deaminase [Flavitalea sp.]|nr:cytidine deaminase [Flavitalea sp.]